MSVHAETRSLDDVVDQLAEDWAARATQYDEAGEFPRADMADLRSSGLLGLLVPERLGGMGRSFHDYIRVAMRLARGSGASALLFNMHASVTGALAGIPDDVARALGVPDSFFGARDRLLRDAVGGAMYGVAISEREAGSRLSAMKTSYTHTGHGFHLVGHKSTCSGAGHLDGYLVAARNADAALDAEPQISYFLVPGHAVRIVEDSWDPLGMRATASNGFELDLALNDDALVGVEGVAVFLAYAMPEWLVASYAAVYVGVAQAAVEAAIAHINGSSVTAAADGGPPRTVSLAESPWVRQRLGRADAQVEAARLVLEEAGRRVEQEPGEISTMQAVYRAKLVAGDTAFAVASSLTEACGLGALMHGSPLERILRDARSGAVMPPSSDISANVLGASRLGVDPGTGLGARPW